MCRNLIRNWSQEVVCRMFVRVCVARLITPTITICWQWLFRELKYWGLDSFRYVALSWGPVCISAFIHTYIYTIFIYIHIYFLFIHTIYLCIYLFTYIYFYERFSKFWYHASSSLIVDMFHSFGIIIIMPAEFSTKIIAYTYIYINYAILNKELQNYCKKNRKIKKGMFSSTSVAFFLTKFFACIYILNIFIYMCA